MHIYGIQKNGTEEFYLQGSNGQTDTQNRLTDMGRGEERVRCTERVTWKLTLPYVKQIANRNLLYGSGAQTGAVSTWRSDAEGGGREVQKGGAMCVPMADSC